MANGSTRGKASRLLRSALTALAGVCLASLALGMSIDLHNMPLVVILASCLAGTLVLSVVVLCHEADTIDEQAAAAKREEAPTIASAPAVEKNEPAPNTPSDEDSPASSGQAENCSKAEPETPAPAEPEPPTAEPKPEAEPTEAESEPAGYELALEKEQAEPSREQDDEDTSKPLSPEVDITPSVSSLDAWEEGSEPPSTLDLGQLSDRLVNTSDPIAELKLFVGDIRTREADGDTAPSPFELYAARLLSEAGLFDSDVKFPQISVVRPPASDMFYLRIHDKVLSFHAYARVIALESALNALRFSNTYFDDPDAREVEEHYQLLQKLTRSIAAQKPELGKDTSFAGDDLDGEWAVRLGISTAIESFQLPHRLAASWRVNVADGNVAFEIELPPELAFPATRYVEDLGLVPTSRDMRRIAASDYALRLALLLANAAFSCSEKIKHVWVAGIAPSAARALCLLSVDFDRWRFFQLDLAQLGDLSLVYHSFAPTMRYEDGILRPVTQSFSLDEPRFCPPRRFIPVSLSSRKIASPLAEELHSNHVWDLSIDEACKREALASDIVTQMDESTEHNVRLILDLAADDPDPMVRCAAERTVGKLIDGSLEADADAVAEEFIAGDELSRAVNQATELLKQKEPAAAAALLRSVLAPIDDAGLYRDGPGLEYRFFPNYVERTLYNRMFTLDGHLPQLVPEAYFDAHYLLSCAYLMQNDAEKALVGARRIVELAPLDTRSQLHLARCLELTDRDDEALEVLTHLLEFAHDPEGLGMGYYRMAFFQWKAGHTLCAQACYHFALNFMPSYAPLITMEMGALALKSPGKIREDLTDAEAEQALRDENVPLAPTSEMSDAFLACTRASLDAEIFPIARNFAWVLGALSRSDILVGVLRSIEKDPHQLEEPGELDEPDEGLLTD